VTNSPKSKTQHIRSKTFCIVLVKSKTLTTTLLSRYFSEIIAI